VQQLLALLSARTITCISSKDCLVRGNLYTSRSPVLFITFQLTAAACLDERAQVQVLQAKALSCLTLHGDGRLPALVRLTGTISPYCGSSANLVNVFMGNNSLSGTIPGNLTSNSQLLILELYGNESCRARYLIQSEC